jgi:hypothetical protein
MTVRSNRTGIRMKPPVRRNTGFGWQGYLGAVQSDQAKASDHGRHPSGRTAAFLQGLEAAHDRESPDSGLRAGGVDCCADTPICGQPLHW